MTWRSIVVINSSEAIMSEKNYNHGIRRTCTSKVLNIWHSDNACHIGENLWFLKDLGLFWTAGPNKVLSGLRSKKVKESI
jgi:hypothetical protein